MLLRVLKGLIHQAHVLCDLKVDILEVMALLQNISNGYPAELAGCQNVGGVMGDRNTEDGAGWD